jgi:hypothetical protein
MRFVRFEVFTAVTILSMRFVTHHVIFEVFTVEAMKSSVFWAMPCNLVKVSWYSGGTCHFHLQCWRANQARKQHQAGSMHICLLHAGFLFGIIFEPKDRSATFLQNVNWISLDCTGYIPADKAWLLQVYIIKAHPHICKVKSSVTTVTRLLTGQPGFNSCKGKHFFSGLYSIQSSSGAYDTRYPIHIRSSMGRTDVGCMKSIMLPSLWYIFV